MRRFYPIALILMASFIILFIFQQPQQPTIAQEDDTRQYESLDSSFTFSYQASWVIDDTISTVLAASNITVLDQAAADFVPGDVRIQIVPPQFTPVLLRAATEIDAQFAMETFVNSFSAPIGDSGIRPIESSRSIIRVDANNADFDVMILSVDVGDGGIAFIIAFAAPDQMATVESDVYALAESMQFIQPTLDLAAQAPITADSSEDLFLLGMWGGHTNWVGRLDLNTDGTQIASIDGNSTIRVWDIATGRPIASGQSEFPISAGPVVSNEGQLVFGSSEGLIWEWDPSTSSTSRNINSISDTIWTMRFNPDRTMLAVGGDDTVVHIYDYESGDEQRVLLGHTDAITDIAFSPDGTRLASASWDETVRIWDVESSEQILEIEAPDGGIVALDISPDGQRLAGGGLDSNVYIYDVATGELLFSLPEHLSGQPVVSVDFAPDSRLLVSGAQDFTIIVWDTETGLPLVAARGPGKMNDVQFSADGTLIFAANDAGVIMVWGIRH